MGKSLVSCFFLRHSVQKFTLVYTETTDYLAMSKGTGSSVTMGWTGWAKFRGPREQGPQFPGNLKK